MFIARQNENRFSFRPMLKLRREKINNKIQWNQMKIVVMRYIDLCYWNYVDRSICEYNNKIEGKKNFKLKAIVHFTPNNTIIDCSEWKRTMEIQNVKRERKRNNSNEVANNELNWAHWTKETRKRHRSINVYENIYTFNRWFLCRQLNFHCICLLPC